MTTPETDIEAQASQADSLTPSNEEEDEKNKKPTDLDDDDDEPDHSKWTFWQRHKLKSWNKEKRPFFWTTTPQSSELISYFAFGWVALGAVLWPVSQGEPIDLITWPLRWAAGGSGGAIGGTLAVGILLLVRASTYTPQMLEEVKKMAPDFNLAFPQELLDDERVTLVIKKRAFINLPTILDFVRLKSTVLGILPGCIIWFYLLGGTEVHGVLYPLSSVLLLLVLYADQFLGHKPWIWKENYHWTTGPIAVVGAEIPRSVFGFGSGRVDGMTDREIIEIVGGLFVTNLIISFLTFHYLVPWLQKQRANQDLIEALHVANQTAKHLRHPPPPTPEMIAAEKKKKKDERCC